MIALFRCFVKVLELQTPYPFSHLVLKLAFVRNPWYELFRVTARQFCAKSHFVLGSSDAQNFFLNTQVRSSRFITNWGVSVFIDQKIRFIVVFIDP
jgi:hypothetical protein